MDLNEGIKQLVLDNLGKESHFIVDVSVPKKPGRGKVLVVIDGDEGVNIDDCAELSRRLSKAMDELGWMDDQYVLEVSTPGIDQPLKFKRQYHKNIGRELKVKFGNEQAEGQLESILEDGIVLVLNMRKKDSKKIQIPFDKIDEATVKISFK